MRIPSALLAALALLLAAPAAQALTQPDGSPIPSNQNLKNYLAGEGESIEPATAAAITPETFDPNCELTFKVIARGGGQKNSFGWYNVTGSKPAPSELYEFLGCNDGVGTVKSLNIKDDPRYEGGRIGFFMASTEGRTNVNCVRFTAAGPDASTLGYLYYSERQYNDDNEGEDSYIHLVTMDSGVYPQAFYFGWEDLFGGGDNDFEDLLTRVEGITCAGGGGDCDTGTPGVCAAGTMQCHNGALTCMPQVQAGAESCNGLDDDCDGAVDDGEGLCGAGKVCDRGQCVNGCFGGEFDCPAGLACNDRNFCVEPACVDVECPAGQVCQADGSCKAACDGISCPLGQVCRVGACVDPCDGVACDAGQVCEAGVCKGDCDCTPCPDGEVCMADGRCVDAGCESVNCDGGQICMGGACVDPCEGAVCPAGQSCQGGACVDGSGGTGGNGAGGSGGTGGNGAGGTGGSGNGGSGSGGTGAGAGAGGGEKKSGGGCSAAEGMAALGFVATGLALVRRRR